MHQDNLLQKLKAHPPQSAQKLYRPKLGGGVAHAGTAFQYYDLTIVAHTTPSNNAHLSTYEEFCEGQQTICKQEYTSGLTHITERCITVIESNKIYSIFDNCEHLATYILEGKSKSPQLRNSLVGVAAGAALGATISQDKTKGVLFGGAALGLLSLLATKSGLLQQPQAT